MYVTIKSIEDRTNNFDLNEFDNFIIGFPTYHSSPSQSILSFITSMEPLSNEKPVYLFTTCGLYSANTLRIFSKECIKKKFIPVLHRSFRCPATDGTLLTPNIKLWFEFEKDINSLIEREVQKIFHAFSHDQHKIQIPRFKLYSIINFPNKLAGNYLYKPSIYLHSSRCTKCGKCKKDCPNHCFVSNKEEFPTYEKDNCEHCYRCIHHCQSKALSLNKKKIVRRQLDHKFYRDFIKG
jgi:ferredoxin